MEDVSLLSLRAEQPAAELTAADFLRRAMRAFGSAYSCLERNRQTCPLLGLVRLSGTPEGVFRVMRPAGGEEPAEDDRNLVNTELRADCLCLSWSSRLTRAGERGNDTPEEEDEVYFSALSRPSLGANASSRGLSEHGEPISGPSLSSSPSSLRAEQVFSACGYRAPVSARMAFGAGRRLQKLRVRSRASVLIGEMRSRAISRGGEEQEAVLLFPCETSLSAATGIADAFTRVALFNLALPCLSAPSSSDNPSGLCPGPCPEGPSGPFALDPQHSLSAQSVQDFPLTLRARSWRLDVRSVHGWCLEIKIRPAQPSRERGQGEGGLACRASDSVVTGQWRRTATLLPQASSSPSAAESPTRTAQAVSLCMEVEVFEAAFDVDLFQAKTEVSLYKYRQMLLCLTRNHCPPFISTYHIFPSTGAPHMRQYPHSSRAAEAGGGAGTGTRSSQHVRVRTAGSVRSECGSRRARENPATRLPVPVPVPARCCLVFTCFSS